MKKTLCVIALAGLSVTASADVRLFVTSSADGYGLNEPQNAFIPTFSTVDTDNNNFNAFDFYNSVGNYNATGQGDGIHGFSVTNYPRVDAPSGTLADPVAVDVDAGAWGYIWYQFRAEPKASRSNLLEVLITDVGGPTTVQTTYYLQNDKQGSSLSKRWDGPATAPGYPELVNNNPQNLIGIASSSLSNAITTPWNMFLHQAGSGSNPFTGVALLGAVNGQAGHTYRISLVDPLYITGVVPDTVDGVFQCTPEPSSVLLFGLAGLLRRRRG